MSRTLRLLAVLAVLFVTGCGGCGDSNPGGTPGPGPDGGAACAAPAIDATSAVSFYDAVKFLFEGDCVTQMGVAPATFTRTRAAVVRGRVTDEAGQPLAGVRVHAPNEPTWGATMTRVDGTYDFAVQGGGRVVLRLEADGRIAAQRSASTRWGRFSLIDDVALIPASTKTAAIDLGGASGWQLAEGETSTDASGTRALRVLFPPSVHATAVANDGTEKPLAHGTLRVTEFTRGPLGPSAMPGEMAPTVAYTYASSLAFDEAADSKAVRFDTKVISYLENFLHKKVGAPVPSGTYVHADDAWSAEESGRVVAIVDQGGGKIGLDSDGDGKADDAAGAQPGELEAIAAFAKPGASFWRVPLAHFSLEDFNDGFGLAAGASGPNGGAPSGGGGLTDCQTPTTAHSFFRCEEQTLGDDIDLVGVGMGLHYESDRVAGRAVAFTLHIPIISDAVPPGVKRAVVDVDVLGKRTHAEYPTVGPQLAHTFTWDGKDVYGRTWPGQTLAAVRVGLVYDGVYLATKRFGEVPDGDVVTTDPTRQEITLSRSYDVPIGVWQAAGLGLGGWTLSGHHVYDPESQVLYMGDGRRRRAEGLIAIGGAVAGQNAPGFSGDTGPSTAAALDSPLGVATAPDGSTYVADSANHRIRRIDPSGTITTFAGNGNQGSGGDGGPATAAELDDPRGLALRSDGSLCVADAGASRVRCIDRAGTIRTILGGGETLPTEDDVVGTDALLDRPEELASAADGTLYVQDVGVIYRVGTNGRVTVAAGLGTTDGDGEGGSARAAKLGTPLGVAVARDGSVFIAEREYHKVRRIAPDGRISTFAGTGTPESGGDGGPAVQARLKEPTRVAVAPDGSVYIAELQGGRIRRVSPAGTISTFAGGGIDDTVPTPARRLLISAIGGMSINPAGQLVVSEGVSRVLQLGAALPRPQDAPIVIPEEDGSVVYVFDGKGRHQKTLDGSTFAELLTFTYDARGYLTRAVDADGDALTIDRDGAGRATAVHAPFGQTTALAYDAAGYLAKVTDPLARDTTTTHERGGLLTKLVDHRGGEHTMAYAPDGRLTRDASPLNSAFTLARASDNPVHVDVTTSLGRKRGHDLAVLDDGTENRATTYEDGTKTTWTRAADGTTTTQWPDGTVTAVREDPDPAWGMLAPFIGSSTTTLPSGLVVDTETTARATFDAGNGSPMSLATLDSETVDPDGTWKRRWDAKARLTTITTAAGRVARAQVDDRGRLTKVTVPGALPFEATYDAHGRIATMVQGDRKIDVTYDPATGYPAELHDSEGHTVRTMRDAAGRPTSVTRPDGATLGLAYDAADNVVSVVPPSKPAHAFGYTPDDLASSYSPPGGPNETASYDPDDAFQSATRADGSTSQVTRDAAGRVASVTFGADTVTPSYDGKTGNLTSLAGPAGNGLAYTYDGSLVTGVTATGAAPGQVRWTYDAKLRIATERVGTSAELLIGRDGDGLVTDVGSLSVTRDDASGQTTAASVDNVAWSFAYDAYGGLSQRNVTAGGATLYGAKYTYDTIGRLVTKTEDGVAWGYSYDLAGRLTQVTKNSAAFATYAYDANGNRTDGGAVVDDQDRLTSGFGATYTYTPNGELATVTAGANVTKYTYDARSQLVRAELPAARGVVTYGLDALGRRVTRALNGAVTHRWVYRNQLQPVAEVDAAGKVVTRYVYGPLSHAPAYFERAGVTYAMVTDHLGSVRSVVRSTDGVVVQALTYDPWGRVLTDTNPGFQPFGYAGGIYDKDTGLVHFGAREYDAATSRWTSKDRGGFAGGLNLYGYVYGDPINYIDRDGRNPVAIAIGLAITVVAFGIFAPSDTAQAPADIAGMAASVPGAGQFFAGLVRGIPFIGRFFGGAARAAARPCPAAAGFSAAEMAVVDEVRAIPLNKLRAAFEAGGAELNVNGRTILVDPGVPASGMTLFGENGFILGQEAFASDEELTKTLLHETYRLASSQSAAGVSGAVAAEETDAAFSFAERAAGRFF